LGRYEKAALRFGMILALIEPAFNAPLLRGLKDFRKTLMLPIGPSSFLYFLNLTFQNCWKNHLTFYWIQAIF